MDPFAVAVIGSDAAVVGAVAAVIAVIPRRRARKTTNGADAQPGILAPEERKNRLSRGESLLVGQSLCPPVEH